MCFCSDQSFPAICTSAMAPPDFLSPGPDTWVQPLASSPLMAASTSGPMAAKLLEFNFHSVVDRLVNPATATVPPKSLWGSRSSCGSPASSFFPLNLACGHHVILPKVQLEAGHFCLAFPQPLLSCELQTPRPGIRPQKPGPKSSMYFCFMLFLHIALLLLLGNA